MSVLAGGGQCQGVGRGAWLGAGRSCGVFVLLAEVLLFSEQ